MGHKYSNHIQLSSGDTLNWWWELGSIVPFSKPCVDKFNVGISNDRFSFAKPGPAVLLQPLLKPRHSVNNQPPKFQSIQATLWSGYRPVNIGEDFKKQTHRRAIWLFKAKHRCSLNILATMAAMEGSRTSADLRPENFLHLLQLAPS